eukprot:1848294-Pyramimonas_sp.AAC.1
MGAGTSAGAGCGAHAPTEEARALVDGASRALEEASLRLMDIAASSPRRRIAMSAPRHRIAAARDAPPAFSVPDTPTPYAGVTPAVDAFDNSIIIASFYGPSLADNGKGALNTPDAFDNSINSLKHVYCSLFLLRTCRPTQSPGDGPQPTRHLPEGAYSIRWTIRGTLQHAVVPLYNIKALERGATRAEALLKRHLSTPRLTSSARWLADAGEPSQSAAPRRTSAAEQVSDQRGVSVPSTFADALLRPRLCPGPARLDRRLDAALTPAHP